MEWIVFVLFLGPAAGCSVALVLSGFYLIFGERFIRVANEIVAHIWATYFRRF